ncbi:hypothetical protein AMS58_03250 [Pseudoalteromonas porphyrae]|uniref:Uncharacterized protein n=1 Tax=Pseudoalteromonas porphyrae TaxID=187330 RepID=A0A0N0M0N7_9GAMM|nr:MULTISPECIES: hypothetical protein [Pseudoalteromonas]KPH64278.1 hypothetical protein ADS77_06215 [Pseudoalteromonas porphyrae]KPH96110.1 hypothetical protein AMS58_03250 [Pseudoalteromonas porphyrae]
MSAVIKTTTPFVLEALLFQALTKLGYEPQYISVNNMHDFHGRNSVEYGDIVTNRIDYNGHQHFRKQNDRWVLRHDADQYNARILGSKQYKKVADFLSELEQEYLTEYKLYLAELAELERKEIEVQRKARVEATREKAIMQAKAQGYSVKEKHINGKIQLICVRHT